jgi:hypothetical protein
VNAALPVFLSAYDPAELPGGTVDPLGFTTGYLALADALLPGMTAAAGQATYLPMLCAGIWIAESEGALSGLSAAAARKRRIDVALRFERLWALACALQTENQDSGDETGTADQGDSKTAGIRGITYVKRELERLTQAGAKQTGAEFPLLAQQYRYGAFGIYGTVAEDLRLLDKSTFALTPGFGEAIGEGFLRETSGGAERKELARASVDPKATVRLSTLRAWGTRAHAGAPLKGETRARLGEAIVGHPVRERMLGLLESVAGNWAGTWSDRALLQACKARALEAEATQLEAALDAALAYDAFLRAFTLIFERVLWLCRTKSDAEQSAAVFGDPVVVKACESLPEVAASLCEKSERLFSLGNRDLVLRGNDIYQVAQYRAAGGDVPSTVRAILGRHAKIQAGKTELGRAKQAWLEERGSELRLTSTRIGNGSNDPRSPDTIRAPDWRLNAALSFLRVTGRVSRAVAR